MVWFYQSGKRAHKCGVCSFQSHYGLILSRFTGVRMRKVICTFNPTMVWFYPGWVDYEITVYQLSIPLWSDFISEMARERISRIHTAFNPTMVWFYLFDGVYTNPGTITFNPTMVWFYRFTTLMGLQRFIQINFQSHYGLILSGVSNTIIRKNTGLSIPLWSDFIDWMHLHPAVFQRSFNPTMVWFYRVTCCNNKCCSCYLSIPLWSDFITSSNALLVPLCQSFQSHYGLILSYIPTT